MLISIFILLILIIHSSWVSGSMPENEQVIIKSKRAQERTWVGNGNKESHIGVALVNVKQQTVVLVTTYCTYC